MNSFKIITADGEAIKLSDLDKEACEFWERTLQPKSYAAPENNQANWFDTIGWAIAQNDSYYIGWKGVVNYMWNIQMNGLSIQGGFDKEKVFTDITIVPISEETYIANQEYLQPYINLVNYWAEKGYIPVSIEN